MVPIGTRIKAQLDKVKTEKIEETGTKPHQGTSKAIRTPI